MAVYTHVDHDTLAAFLDDYSIGALVRHTGVESGVENTNYIIETHAGRFILTLFERRVAATDIPYFIDVMSHFATAGAPTPTPVARQDGTILGELKSRPAIIITFLNGAPDMTPGPERARALGACLAGLHNAAAGFAGDRDNALSLDGWRALAAACGESADKMDALAPGLGQLIDEELVFVDAHWPTKLPSGVIHADLFPDNVFFEGDAVSGVIDFYFSCTDFFAYDLAICLNAWCSAASAPPGAAPMDAFLTDNAAALVSGYNAVRPLSAAERAALPTLMRGATLRFLLTRLYDWLNQVEGALVAVKDPLEYRDLLLSHRRQAPADWAAPLSDAD